MTRRKSQPNLHIAIRETWWIEYRTLLACALLTVAVLLVYSWTLSSPFIYDDAESIVGNSSIRAVAPLTISLNPPKDLPTSGRPFVNFTFAVNYAFGGLKPFGYHFFNVVLHALSSCLLYLIVCRTLVYLRWDEYPEILSLAVAILWALHPLNTEAVQYVTQRTELMVGLFYLATLYCSLRYWEASISRTRMLWGIIASISCALGMASKEVMVTAPLVVLLYERTFVADSFRQALRRSYPLYLALAATWLLLLFLNVDGPRAKSAGFDRSVPASVWWFTQAQVLWMYLRLVAWPWPLSIHYEIPYLKTFSSAWPWLTAVALLLLATLILLWRRKAAGFALASVFLILAPTLLDPIPTEIAAERRMYLPLAAILAAVLVGGVWVARQLISRLSIAESVALRWLAPVSISVLFVMAILYGATSVGRLAAYRDETILWQEVVNLNPHDYVAQYNLGTHLLSHGNLLQAISHFQLALQAREDYTAAHVNLGRALAESNRPDEAIPNFRIAIEQSPNLAEAHYNLGTALARMGRPAEAIEPLKRAIELRPDLAQADYQLGLIYLNLQNWADAAAHLERASVPTPDAKADVLNNLGVAMMMLKKPEQAQSHWQKAIRLNPNHADAHSNLGKLLQTRGENAQAVEHFEKLAGLHPDSLEALKLLASGYLALGRSRETIAATERALAIAKAQGNKQAEDAIQTWLDDYRASLPSP